MSKELTREEFNKVLFAFKQRVINLWDYSNKDSYTFPRLPELEAAENTRRNQLLDHDAAQRATIEQLEAKVKEIELDGEEYRQYAMDEVRKACQEAGVLVDADDSICLSKAGDIARKVKELEALYADSCSALNAHMEIHAQVVNRVKELEALVAELQGEA